MRDEVPRTQVTVELSGDYDIARTGELHDALLSAYRGQSEVVADVSKVTFMDSTALRALLEVHVELQRFGAAIRVMNPGPMVYRLLQLSGTAPLFGVDATAEG